MAFTAKDVQDLRERSGCGMMDCKKALTQADGDMEKAVEILREKGLAASAKKAGRIAAEGVVVAVVDEAKKVACVLEVNSETDFVGKNADFVAFVEACAKTVINENPADIEALAACKLDGSDMTVDEALKEKILVIGENMKLRRFVRYEGDVVSYVHGGGRIGVLVKFDTDVADKAEFVECGKDVAMQIAAINPAYLNREEVPAEVIAKEKEILMAQIQGDEKLKNKPEQVIAKMVEGKIGKYYKENCLLEQAFVKDGNVNVAQYVANTAKALGGKIEVVSFVRFEKGEGLEKREENFAEEIAKQLQK